MKKLINLLRHREMDKIDVNGGAKLEEHRKKLMSKPMLGEVFAHFHDQFRKLDHQLFNASGLEIELGSGIAPMRDRAEFEQKHPSLKIVDHRLDRYYLKYIFSGGLNFKQLCPDKLSPMLALLQICLRPLNRWLALHHVIVLQKIKI